MEIRNGGSQTGAKMKSKKSEPSRTEKSGDEDDDTQEDGGAQQITEAEQARRACTTWTT